MRYDFFLAMRIPNVTHQQKKIAVKNGKPLVYEDARLKDARQKFLAYLAMHKPKKMMTGPVSLRTSWLYEPTGKHKAGEFKTTRPDTDNLVKLFKDCMTQVGFWKDDAQVCREYTEKLYWTMTGIHVIVADIESDRGSGRDPDDSES